jgi:acyl carrier protein
MFEKIKNTLLNYVDVDPEEITPDTAILQDLKMNSYDIVTMIGELEDEFDIEVDTDDLQQINTVGDLADYITKQL